MFLRNLMKLTGFCFLLLFGKSLCSQSYPNTFLWRITGKGLKQPSYLFGTIHIMDKRVFNFTDSVYRALENTEGLAIEVNPDEMMSYAITQAVNSEGKKLDDILSEEDYNRYGARLSKKLGKPAAQITSKDIIAERNRWLTSNNFKESMQTFVDAWFYGVAKASGKWVGGIEDASDQGNLLDELIDQVDIESVLSDESDQQGSAVLSKMIKIYEAQNLNAVEAMSAGMNDRQRYEMLGKRNIKMAHRIDSLAGVRAVFFAVGVAHLPGQDGLIHLLQEKGFVVEPVISGKKIPAHQYQYKQLPVQWQPVIDPAYTVTMPGSPAMIKLYGLVDSYFFMDIFNYTGYYSIASNKSLSGGKAPEEIIKQMYPGAKIEKLKMAAGDGIDMQDYLLNQKGLHIRIRHAAQNSHVFLLMMFAKDKQRLQGKDAQQYFSSFSIKNSGYLAPRYFTYRDSIIGLSLNTTSPLQFNAQLSSNDNNNWKVTSLSSTDMSNGLFVILTSKEVKRFFVLTDDNAVHNDVQLAAEKAYSEFQSKDTIINQIPVRLFYNMINRDYPALRATMLSIIRGGRNVVINITADTSAVNQLIVQDMLSSLRFDEEHESKDWRSRYDGDSTFSVWAPSSITANQTLQTSIFERKDWAAYDTMTATSYIVLLDQPKPYYWIKNQDELKNIYKNLLIHDTDSLIQENDIVSNGLEGFEILTSRKNAGIARRNRVIFAGNGTYVLTVSSKKDALFTPHTNRFFTDFQQTTGLPAFNYLQPKTGHLLAELQAKDSTRRAMAIEYLETAPFQAEDADLLHPFAFKTYQPLYEYSDSFGVAEIIAERLLKLKTPSTVDYISRYYPAIAPEDNARRLIALNILSGTHTSKSYQALAMLLANAGLTESPSALFRRSMRDSLALTAVIADKLLPLSADSIFTPSIATIMSALIDSGFVKPEMLKPHVPGFVSNARKVKEAISDSTGYDHELSSLIGLLPRLADGEADLILHEFQYVPDIDLQLTAVATLLKHGREADPKVIARIAEDKSYRVYLFDVLKRINKSHLFPSQLATARSFAESYLFNSSEDHLPESLEFIAEKTVTVGGNKCRFYLFKVSFDEEGEKSAFLGIAGGYNASDITLDEDNNVTGIYWDDTYHKNKIDGLFKKYLESISFYQE